MPRGTPFQPGNKFGKGRPPGSRNKSTLLTHGPLERYSELIETKCASLGGQGNVAAIKIHLDRTRPRRRSAPVHIRMPNINTAADVKEAGKRVIQAIAKGKLTPSEGTQMMIILDAQRRAIQSHDHEQKLEQLQAFIQNRRAA